MIVRRGIPRIESDDESSQSQRQQPNIPSSSKDHVDDNDHQEVDEEDIEELNSKKRVDYLRQRLDEDMGDSQKVVIGYLRIVDGNDNSDDSSIEYPVRTGLNIVGRAAQSAGGGVTFTTTGVSSIHALIESSIDGTENFVEDLASTNGTTIGQTEHRLAPWKMYELTHKKHIAFGPLHCVFELKNPGRPLGEVDSVGNGPSINSQSQGSKPMEILAPTQIVDAPSLLPPTQPSSSIPEVAPTQLFNAPNTLPSQSQSLFGSIPKSQSQFGNTLAPTQIVIAPDFINTQTPSPSGSLATPNSYAKTQIPENSKPEMSSSTTAGGVSVEEADVTVDMLEPTLMVGAIEDLDDGENGQENNLSTHEKNDGDAGSAFPPQEPAGEGVFPAWAETQYADHFMDDDNEGSGSQQDILTGIYEAVNKGEDKGETAKEETVNVAKKTPLMKTSEKGGGTTKKLVTFGSDVLSMGSVTKGRADAEESPAKNVDSPVLSPIPMMRQEPPSVSSTPAKKSVNVQDSDDTDIDDDDVGQKLKQTQHVSSKATATIEKPKDVELSSGTTTADSKPDVETAKPSKLIRTQTKSVSSKISQKAKELNKSDSGSESEEDLLASGRRPGRRAAQAAKEKMHAVVSAELVPLASDGADEVAPKAVEKDVEPVVEKETAKSVRKHDIWELEDSQADLPETDISDRTFSASTSKPKEVKTYKSTSAKRKSMAKAKPNSTNLHGEETDDDNDFGKTPAPKSRRLDKQPAASSLKLIKTTHKLPATEEGDDDLPPLNASTSNKTPAIKAIIASGTTTTERTPTNNSDLTEDEIVEATPDRIVFNPSATRKKTGSVFVSLTPSNLGKSNIKSLKDDTVLSETSSGTPSIGTQPATGKKRLGSTRRFASTPVMGAGGLAERLGANEDQKTQASKEPLAEEAEEVDVVMEEVQEPVVETKASPPPAEVEEPKTSKASSLFEASSPLTDLSAAQSSSEDEKQPEEVSARGVRSAKKKVAVAGHAKTGLQTEKKEALAPKKPPKGWAYVVGDEEKEEKEEISTQKAANSKMVVTKPETGKRGGKRAKNVVAVEEAVAEPPAKRLRASRDPTPTPESQSSSQSLAVKSSSQNALSTPKIMLTGVGDEYKEIVTKLGGTVVESWAECTHCVSDKIRRTVKFLCALAAGKHILTVKWLEQSQKAGHFIGEAKFLPKDKATEKQYGFSFEKSSHRAQNKALPPFLSGIKIYATPNVKPGRQELSEMVTAAGGQLCDGLPSDPPSDSPEYVLIGCAEDIAECRRLHANSWTVVTNEFVLSGILRQEVDMNAHKLDLNDQVSPPSSAKKKKK
ncbi:hypothetical protein HDV05_000779 [Chytridiales sp. JEL 0842]|nr:hypothetical protein HDV05_000779 [Chytridiales sp. JEL 0842]